LDNISVCEVIAEETLALTGRQFVEENDQYRRRHLQQQMAWFVYEALKLLKDYQVSVGSRMPEKPLLLLPMSPFIHVLRAHFAEHTVGVWWAFGQGRLSKASRRMAAIVVRMTQALVTIVKSLLNQQPLDREPLTISVQNFRGGGDPELRHDLFWVPVKWEKFRIVLEYGVTAYSFGSAFLDDLEKRGILMVETHLGRKHFVRSVMWRPGWIYLSRGLWALNEMRQRVWTMFKLSSDQWFLEFWKAVHDCRFALLVGERLDFYQRFNIKADFSSGFSFHEPAHSKAIAQCGGITCTAQYTTWPDALGNHTSTSSFHLYFGTYLAETGRPLLAEVNLPLGYLYKTPLGSRAHRVDALKDCLLRRGVAKSICFLDENFYDSQDVRERILPLYQHLMQMVLEQKEFGVLVKPKKNRSLEVLREELRGIYDRAVDTGRFIALDWRWYPGLAAQCADLTIGPPTTATMEAAIMGCPTIYINALGYVPDFLAAARANVYETDPEVLEAIEKFFQSADRKEIGFHSEQFLRSIDHFRDDSVSERICDLLVTYLQKVEKGLERSEAMSQTVNHFVRGWGVLGKMGGIDRFGAGTCTERSWGIFKSEPYESTQIGLGTV
jgi:hypothetical protein